MTTPLDNDELQSLILAAQAIMQGDGHPHEFRRLFEHAPALLTELLSYRMMIERRYAATCRDNVIPFKGDAA